MKKLSILILSIGLIIGLNSFTYKETKLKINKLDKSIKKLAPPDKFHLFKCVVEDNGTSYYGTKCEVSVWDDCPKLVSCKKLLDDNGDPMPLSVVTWLNP